MSKNQHPENSPSPTSSELPILDDFYIFDLTLGCRYVAFRFQGNDSPVGKSIYDIMTPTGIEELLAHMLSDSHAPMFVKTSRGIALVLSSLVPSASLGILIYSRMGSDNLYRICRRFNLAARYSNELLRSGRCRMTNNCLQNEHRLLSLINIYMSIFSTDMCNRMLTGNLTQLLEKQIRQISLFVGCPIHIDRKNDIIAYSDFDIGMFSALVLLLAANARLFSSDGCASLCLEMTNRTPIIRFSLNIFGDAPLKLPSFESLRYTAHRKSMPYEHYRTDGVFSGKLSPLPEYLSHLTKRSPQDMPLESELESFLRMGIPEIDIDSLLTIDEMLALRERLRSNADS